MYDICDCKDLCEGEGFSNNVVLQNEEKVERIVKTTVNKVNSRLGTTFTLEQIKEVLINLNFEVEVEGEEILVSVPDFRLDVTCDADIAEEVIRVLGFDNVVSTLPHLDTKLGALTETQLKEKLVRDYLLWNGIDECLTYSLVSKKESKLFALANDDELYKIINPLTEEREYFRGNVLHSLLVSASYNISRQNKDLSLFEISNIDTVNRHEKHLAIVLAGNQLDQGNMSKSPFDFYHMKGLFEGVCELLGVEPTRLATVRAVSV